MGPQPFPGGLVPEPPPAACRGDPCVSFTERAKSIACSPVASWDANNSIYIGKPFNRWGNTLFRKIILQKIKQNLYQNNSLTFHIVLSVICLPQQESPSPRGFKNGPPVVPYPRAVP